jgi:coniferyl-aldehyde dehydrogenase
MQETSRDSMMALLDRQRADYLAEGEVTLERRIDRIERAIRVIIDNKDRIAATLSDDFGHRSRHQSLFTDVAAAIGPLKNAKKHVAQWMRSEKRKVDFPLNLLGAKARVEFQPLGVVGVISPWNFPINLTFGPLAGVLAAGNRAMIKPSEFTPKTSELMAEMVTSAFDELEVAVVLGGPETGADFTTLPFDHLLFTGATSIARHVMRAASENLVPVTLELGGKSPVIVGRSSDLSKTTDAIMAGKMMNAGQICLAPDYVFVPQEKVGDFVESTKASVAKMFPTLLDNDDYTSVINERHYDRLNSYIEDAQSKGAEVVSINPAGEDFSQQPSYKIPPTLLLGADDSMQVMQDEIFGPLMPVKGYGTVDETLDYINDHPRPLGLYYFGGDSAEEQRVLTHTTSGGVTVNDVIMHVAQEDLPFGGVGPSGMGSYHGIDGFRAFSHAKSIFTQSRINVAELAGLRPPYGEKIMKTLNMQIGK